MLNIVEVNQKNKGNLENFLKQNGSSLLQSFDWGEFQEELGREIWQLAVLEKNDIIASALVVKYNLPLGKSYLYCSRGVKLGATSYELRVETLKLFLKKVEEIAQKEDSIFFRVDPEWGNREDNRTLLNSLGFRKANREVQPKNTLILDISRSEEEILSQMHSKTRYNIRLAERKGVKIRISDGNKRDFEAFWKLMEETSKRDGFKSHPKEYYKKQLEFFGKRDLIKLFVAEFEGKIIATITVSFYGQNAVYLHGASSYEYRKYMAPHLIQWEAIKEAKRRDCKYYDFWGIEGSDQRSRIEDQDWKGITRFKKGFALEFGIEKNYIGAWDLPIQKMWYRVYNFMNNLRCKI